jgi:SagB-type dehydrogenase family enzyme
MVTALEQRRTTREYSTSKLSLEDLSAILWAANGVNRPDGKRTAPSAHGRQYIDIYVAADTGVYLYDAPHHKLIEVTNQNVKDKLARQGHVATSSHVLVLVADLNKVPGSAEDAKLNWAHSTAGTIAENVHLMAAARGVGTGIVAGIKADNIRAALNLAKEAVPLYVMPLGSLK